MASARLVLPIRSFNGMSRLQSALSISDRRQLSVDLAQRCVDAGIGSGLSVVVVTGDESVATWATDQDVQVARDPGLGLDVACRAGIADAPDIWVVCHADLPLVSAAALGAVVAHADSGTVLVPSVDGGTNVIAGRGTFPFSFGPGSFHRHLAVAPDATVLPSTALSVEIDTPSHMTSLAQAGYI